MKQTLIAMIIALCIFILVISILVFSFVEGMKPDKDEQEKVRNKAEQYLEEEFNDDFEIFDILYDNMGNYFYFEYAAKVRNKKNDIEFLVYYSEDAKKMVDTYTADKWADELENEIRTYADEIFGEINEFYVFYDDEIGKELGIEPANPGSYKDFDAVPTIRITIPREKSQEDQKLLNEFVAFLKTEIKLHQGAVGLIYIAETGVILDEEEWKEF